MQIGLGISPTTYVAVPAFTPASISGLQLWLDASDSATLFQDSSGTTPATADGDPIGRWSDKSGNGYHATQTDGTRRPLRKNAIQNGLNVTRWDGSNDSLVCGDVMDLGTRNLYIASVVKFNTATGVISGKSRAGGYPYRYSLVRDQSIVYFIKNDNSDGFGTSLTSANSSSAFQLICASYPRSTGMIIRVNKSVVASNSATNSDDYQSSYIFQVGNYQDASGNQGNLGPLDGDLCEILVYMSDSTISTSSIQSIENYLYSKWGIQ